jgi:hypothetical protein
MMREVIRGLEVGFLAEVGRIAFVVAFLLILVRVLLMTRGERESAKNLPLDDPENFFLQSNHE